MCSSDLGLAAFQVQALTERRALSFEAALKVRIIAYDSATRRAQVEMIAPGRLAGSQWYLDANALGG